MGRILKILGIVIGAVVVLLVGAVLVISFLIDPNDYKDQISAAVSRATGRELTIDGDLELDVFPSIRIAVGRATLSNAEGFGSAPFAQIDSAGLDLALLPLLAGNIEIGEARLSGLVLNLSRDASGRDNWQDLGGTATPAAGTNAAPQAQGGGTLELDVGSIAVSDARVSFADAATGNNWVLDNFDLQASDLGSNASFPLSMSFNFSGAAVTVDVEANAKATVSLPNNRYSLADLDVAIDGRGSGWPGGQGRATVTFDNFVADLNAQTLNLENLTLEMLGMKINGTLAGQNLLGDLALTGGIEIEQFNPRDLLDALGTPIETADPDVLRRASADAQFIYDSNQMGMRNMRLALDDSTLTGRLGMESGVLRFALTVDSINIDRYLPPAQDTPSTDEGSLDEVDLPIDPLRNFRASGTLALNETQFSQLKFSNASFALEANNGTLTITPSAALYGGTYSGRIGIRVSGNAATLDLVQNISGMNLLPFAKDYLGIDTLSGTGELKLDVSATGSNLGEMRRALDGDVSFAFTDGAWSGIDALYELRRLRAVFEKEDVPERPEGERRTAFESVTASGTVEDAVLTNKDFNVTLPFMTLTGGGTVNLLDNGIDFMLTAAFSDVPLMQDDPLMNGLIGQSLPINVGGTLSAPSIRPDFASVVRARVQSQVQEQLDEKRNEVRDRLRQRLQDAAN